VGGIPERRVREGFGWPSSHRRSGAVGKEEWEGEEQEPGQEGPEGSDGHLVAAPDERHEQGQHG